MGKGEKFLNLFVKIIGIAVLTLICYLLIKPSKPEMAFLVSLIGSCIIVSLCLDMVISIIDTLTGFVEKTNINQTLFTSVLKIVGVGYLTEFASSMCDDAGNKSLADKVAFAGKIFILFLSLPIINSLLNVILEILP